MAALVLAAISCTDSFKSGTGNPVPSCLHKKIIHASDIVFIPDLTLTFQITIDLFIFFAWNKSRSVRVQVVS